MDINTKIRRLQLAARAMDVDLSRFDIDNGRLVPRDQNRGKPASPETGLIATNYGTEIQQVVTTAVIATETTNNNFQTVAEATFEDKLALPVSICLSAKPVSQSPQFPRVSAKIDWGVGGLQTSAFVDIPTGRSVSDRGSGLILSIPASFVRVSVINQSLIVGVEYIIGASLARGALVHPTKAHRTQWHLNNIVPAATITEEVPPFASSVRIFRGAIGEPFTIEQLEPDGATVLETVTVGAAQICPEYFLAPDCGIIRLTNNGAANINRVRMQFGLSL